MKVTTPGVHHSCLACTPPPSPADAAHTVHVLAERIAGHWTLDDARWEAHEQVHRVLASSLSEYKAQANEWRQTLSDLRGDFLTTVEYRAEQQVVLTRIDLQAAEIRMLREAREREIGEHSGSRGVTSWLAPNVWAIIAGLVGVAALVLLAQKG